jgi:hypothetical protein
LQLRKCLLQSNGMSNPPIHEIAAVVVAATDIHAEQSAAATLQQALTRTETLARDIEQAQQGTHNEDVTETHARLVRAVGYLGLAMNELVAADDGTQQLLQEWHIIAAELPPPSVALSALPGNVAQESEAAPPATVPIADVSPSGSQTGQETDIDLDAYNIYFLGSSHEHGEQMQQFVHDGDDRPVPRLSEQDMFTNEMQAKLNTPIEEVFGITGEQADMSNKRSALSRLRRAGVVTARDALLMGPWVYKIHSLSIDPQQAQTKLSEMFPDLPIMDERFRHNLGAMAAQVCTSLDQIPVQALPAPHGRNTNMFDKPLTMADVIDPQTGRPYPTDRRDYYGLEYGRPPRLPHGYNRIYHHAARFVHQFRRTRRELYGEDA